MVLLCDSVYLFADICEKKSLNIPGIKIYCTNKNDFKRWIKEAVKDFLLEFTKKEYKEEQNEEDLLNRKDIAKFLRVSLPTLTNWINRGSPAHKQRGRVYFDKTEVVQYIKENKIGQFKFGSRFERLSQDIEYNR